MTLADRYCALLAEIQAIAEAAGRDPSSVQLIAVTKHAALDQMQQLYAAGCRHFGENKLQAALPKIAELPQDIQWHFIGPLQSNKVRKIVSHFTFIHSVGSLAIAQKIAECSFELGKSPKIFLQVNTSEEPSKGGFSEEELLKQFEQLLKLNLTVIGLMTMAPLSSNTERVRACFSRLKSLRDRLSLPHLSMGMSQDYPIAIQEGATFLRIGSKLFN